MLPLLGFVSDSTGDRSDMDRVHRATSRNPVVGCVNVRSAVRSEMLDESLTTSIIRGRKSRNRAGEETLKLPNRERAEIQPEKIRDYLLSSIHSKGNPKAEVFFGLGYTVGQWERLAADLPALGRNGDAEQVASPHGEKFRIVGRIVGPNGRSAVVLSIWICDHGDPIPRLVTAYPARLR